MTTSRCAMCGPLHAHHPTRRPAPGVDYFDPALRLALCPPHHVAAHVVLRAVGLEWPRAETSGVAYRLRALAVHARWLADHGAPFEVVDPRASRALADLLDEAADALAAQAGKGAA